MEASAGVKGQAFMKHQLIQNVETHGMELYRSDGTEKGTYLLKDIFPGFKNSDPKFLATLGNDVLFSAYDDHVSTLWKTDGSVNGTMKINGGTPDPFYLAAN